MKKYLLLGLMSVLLVGCDKVPGAANLPGVKEVVQERATEAMFAHINDPVLKKHMVAQANTTSFWIRSDSSGKGTIQVNEMELKGEDFAMSTWEEKDGVKSNEMIMMGDTTYLKDYKDNAWWKQTATTEDLPTGTEEPAREPIDFKEMYETVKNTVTYTNLGQEACGDLTCYKYQEVDSANPEATRTFWFDTKDYLMRKEEAKFGEFTNTSEYSYDGIKVMAPTPTKEVPEGKSIYEYMFYEGASGGQQTGEVNKAMEKVKQMQQQVNQGEMPETWQPEEPVSGE